MARGENSPEFAVSGPPGVKLTGAWVREDQQDMANTSGHLGRAVWDRTWLATVRGGTGLPASCVPAVPVPLRDLCCPKSIYTAHVN